MNRGSQRPTYVSLVLVGMINLCLLIFSSSASAESAIWKQAERDIRRLAPAEIPGLPFPVRSALEERGCTIPQTYDTTSQPHNVVSGELAAKGQQDWAVLCSVDGYSTILIFWGGLVQCPSEIEPFQDSIFLQGIGNGRIGYSRLMTLRDKSSMIQTARAFGDEGSFPPGDHQGLDDAFMGKGSSGWYCADETWARITGSD